jgi:hypothetical protein
MSNDLAADLLGPKFLGRRYLRVHELIELGLAANSRTLANLVKRGELPAPIKMGRLLLFPVVPLAERLTQLEHTKD